MRDNPKPPGGVIRPGMTTEKRTPPDQAPRAFKSRKGNFLMDNPSQSTAPTRAPGDRVRRWDDQTGTVLAPGRIPGMIRVSWDDGAVTTVYAIAVEDAE